VIIIAISVIGVQKMLNEEVIPVAKRAFKDLLDAMYIENFFEKYRDIKIERIEEMERFLINFNLAT